LTHDPTLEGPNPDASGTKKNIIKTITKLSNGSNAVIEYWTHDPKLLVLNPATLAAGKMAKSLGSQQQ
jgi:hypothetical protein